MSILSNIVTKVFGKKSDKDLKKMLPIVDEVNKHYQTLNNLTDEQIKNRFNEIRKELAQKISSEKESLISDKKDLNEVDDILFKIEKDFLEEKLVEVFAIVKDVSRRLCGTSY